MIDGPANAPKPTLPEDFHQSEPQFEPGTFRTIDAAVLVAPELSIYDRSVYGVLVWHADKHGYCWPSIRTIVGKAGCSKRQVLRAIDRLVKLGYIEKRRRLNPATRANTSTKYRVL